MDLTFITAPVAAFFRDRVFGHLPSTIAGGLAAVAGALATYLGTLPIDPKWSLLIYIACALLAGISAAYKPKAIAPTMPPPPAGFVRLGLLLTLLVLALVFALPARAQDSGPKFGGCMKSGETCFGPSVSITLVALDLKTGAVTTSVSPGLGYGVTFNAREWYTVGVAGYATFRDTAVGQRVVASVVFSFVEYVRIGAGAQVGPGARPFLLLGVGSDFGAAR